MQETERAYRPLSERLIGMIELADTWATRYPVGVTLNYAKEDPYAAAAAFTSLTGNSGLAYNQQRAIFNQYGVEELPDVDYEKTLRFNELNEQTLFRIMPIRSWNDRRFRE